MLDIGERLQDIRYRIVDILGQGGMATVYLAVDGRLGDRRVAIKEMDPNTLHTSDQEWALTAFRQEAEVLARLSHRSIAKVTDFFEERGYWYLVMEYVPGETLEAAIRRVRRFSEEQTMIWAGQLADMLNYLHGQDPPIIFRDLKPANVMVQVDGNLKLIDFGIARFFKPEQQSDTVILGTPGYASPEQYGQGQTDPRSDVYSLAVLLHQLLTGYDPAASPMHLPPVQQLRPDVSAGVAAAINQSLQTDPAARFNTVMAFASALGAPLPGPTKPIEPLNKTAPALAGIGLWLREHKIAGYVGAAIVVLALAILVYFLFKPGIIKDEFVTPTEETEQVLTEMTLEEQTQTAVVNSTATVSAQLSATALAITEAVITPASTQTATATDTPTPTPSPTPTGTPSPTPIPTTPAPTPCSVGVAGGFQSIYQNSLGRLGCPVSAANSLYMAQETFQNGRMFWRNDNDKIYVLYGNGIWVRYNDIWAEGQNEFSCGTPQSPPTPKRGFGAIWCAYDNVRNGLGGATSGEWPETNTVQDFTGGFILRDSSGHTYTLLADNGTWQ